MATVVVDQEVFKLLKQAYSEKFGGSPSLLIAELNRTYLDKKEGDKDLISDKTIRNFFSKDKPTNSQEKNLNYLTNVLLGYESYQQALRSKRLLEKQEAHEILVNPEINTVWLKRYKTYIQAKCKFVKIIDMIQPIELNKIYTELYVSRSIKARKQKVLEDLLKILDDSKLHHPTQMSEDEKIPALDAVECYSKLLLWGGPGTGKTTFLKHLALRSINALDDGLLPIFIALKTILNEQDNFSFIDLFKQEFNFCGLDSEKLVQDFLIQGKCLILLDGLDEVKTSSRIYHALEMLVKQYPKNHFIMTCRTGAIEYVFEDFAEVEVVSFDEEGIASFTNKWFLVNQKANLEYKFFEKLNNNPSIKALATNPLMLTMLCLVFEDSLDMPRNRFLLIEEVVNTFMHRWDSSKRIARHYSVSLSTSKQVKILAKLAFEALDRNPHQYFWRRADLEKILADYVENLLEITLEDFDSKALIKELEANGLLVEKAKGIYSFSHLIFQEYFAAQYIIENHGSIGLKSVIDKHLPDQHWEEVFLILAGQFTNADEFIRLIFKKTNTLIESEAIQKMLIWLDSATTLHEVRSSSWRAFYLVLDQIFPIYTDDHVKAQNTNDQRLKHIYKLAFLLRENNRKYGKIIPRPGKTWLAIWLMRLNFFASFKLKRITGIKFLPVESIFQQIEPILTQIPISMPKDPVNILKPGFEVSKTKDTISIETEGQEVIVSSSEIQRYTPSDSVETGIGFSRRPQTFDNSGLHKELVDALKIHKMEDAADNLIFIKETLPSTTAPHRDWQKWKDEVVSFMILYLHWGFKQPLSRSDIQALEDYFYTNALLVECISNDCACSKELHDQIIDHLLLPDHRIPMEL